MTRVLFVDAEETLWQRKPGAPEFWDDPTLERAKQIFSRAPHAQSVLQAAKKGGIRIIVLSIHNADLLSGLLDWFGYASLVEEITVKPYPITDSKADWALEHLHNMGVPASDALMVGDHPEYDIQPFMSAGIPALMLDRPTNMGAGLPRVDGWMDVCMWLVAGAPSTA